MPNSRLRFSSLVAALSLAACGGGELTVEVYTEGSEDNRPVPDLPVEFLPFDRDSIFEVLGAQATTTEPQVSSDLQASSDSVQALQGNWRDTETQWNEVRDSLRQLSDALRGQDPRSGEYRARFERFNNLESRERTLNRQRERAFDRFTALQQATQQRLDSVRAVIEAWEDDAFADYGDVESELLVTLGREIVYDTTNAQGTLTRRLGGGTWWVHSRVSTPGGELYWNVPVDPSQTDTLRLTPENAERRQRF